MLATTNDVKTITGKVVDNELVTRAQYVIEAYIGRFEVDVTDTKDIEILKRAVSYQSAYMLNNEDIVYEQMRVSTSGQSDAYTTFKQNDNTSPFIAPMAVMICEKLTFMRSRTVHTGKVTNEQDFVDWRTL